MIHADDIFTIVYVQVKSYAHFVGMFMTYRGTKLHMLHRMLHQLSLS